MSCPFSANRRVNVIANHATQSQSISPTATTSSAGAAPEPEILDAPAGFADDPITFMREARGSQPDAFTLRRSKNNQYVVLNDPKLIEDVLSDQVNFGPPMTPNMSVTKNVFGVSREILDKHEERIVQRIRGFLIKHKESLSASIADEMKLQLSEAIGEERIMDLRDLGEAIFWPMTQVLLGEHAVKKVEPGLYKAWETIDGMFGKALKGHEVPEVKAAVDLAANNFMESVNGKSGKPMGPFLEFYTKEVPESPEAACRFATAAWWGGLGNTWPSTVWTFGMLLADPEARRQAYAEVDREFADQPDAEGNYDFDRLSYMSAALMEVLRLKTYSIAWRLCRKDTEVQAEGGKRFTLKKNSLVAVPWCTQHYNEDVWSDPEVFRPERHLPGREENKTRNLSSVRERLALSPFSWGPHKCSGYPLAMLEIPVALAVVFQMYDMELLDPLPGHDWKAAFGVVGPDSQPTRVRFTRRPSKA